MSFWTKERDEELLKLHRQGMSFEEIGGRLGCSRAAAGGRHRRLKDGEARRHATGLRWTVPMDHKLIKLAQQGWTYAAIGEVLGCSERSARQRAYRLRVEAKKPEPQIEASFPKKTISLGGPRWSHEGIGGVS